MGNSLLVYYLIILIPVFLLVIKNGKKDIFHPLCIFPISLTLYWIGGTFRFDAPQYSQAIELKYIIAGGIAFIFYVLGYLFSKPFSVKISDQKRFRILNLQGKVLKQTAGLFLLLISPLLLNQLRFIIPALFTRGVGGYGFFYDAFRQGIIFGNPLIWCAILIVILLFDSFKQRIQKSAMVYSWILLLLIVIFLRLGVRMHMFYIIIFSIVMVHYKHYKISFIKGFIGVFIGLILAQYISFMRAFIGQGLVFAFFRTNEIMVNNLFRFFPWNINEFHPVGVALKEFFDSGWSDFTYGTSYIQALVIIPPLLGRYLQVVDTSSLIRSVINVDSAAQGGGSFVILEGYINFGWIGIALHLFLFGFLFGVIYRLYINNKNYSVLLWIYALSVPVFMLHGVRTSLASFTNVLLNQYLMVPIALLFIYNFVPKKKVKS
ncbi:MAG: oligosaccharide repeat unit polymerase [Clostridiaceae bacterium]|nr:oligosaccharide repeat unit polymerase [Clostridiaceae bacterium]